jgi:hypothetical protein
MTDETHGMDPIEEPVPSPDPVTPAEAHDEKSVLAGAGDFTSGEGLVAFAGMVILAVWLIFDVFLDDYGVATLTLLLATLVVFTPRMDPAHVAKVLPVAVIMKTVGYTFALIGVFEVIEAVEEGFFEGAATIIAALVEYAAFVMAFIGARQIKI